MRRMRSVAYTNLALLRRTVLRWLFSATANMTSRSFPSRHKAQQEEEDAAALKLGPGTF